MKISEVIVFVIYLIFMLSIGVYFFFKNRSGGEKTYFLGGRQMGPWVTALSAGASDMSAWVLMGLPTSIYALGVGQVWISVGLAIGHPPVPDQPVPVQVQGPADHLCGDLPGGLHRVCCLQREGLRHPL